MQSSSLVAEDLSNGAETFKLRVVNQYNDEVVSKEFEYITAVENGVAMVPEGVELPQLEPNEACTCKSTCTFECHYDESNSMLRVCQTECACNSQANSCAVARFTSPSTRFQVFYTPDKGWALQTLEDIKPNQALFEYVGVLSLNQYHKMDNNDDYLFAFRHGSRRYLLNAHLKGNLARFVNHSCRPNCCPLLVEASTGAIPRVLIYSLRQICAGEELVMDYGEDWWLAKAGTVRGCWCGSDECQYDEDWCDEIVENGGKGMGRTRQTACKATGGREPRRQLATKRVRRPVVATMKPKDLDDLMLMVGDANADDDAENGADAHEAEEEEAANKEMEPPPAEKKQRIGTGTNGTAPAVDGNN